MIVKIKTIALLLCILALNHTGLALSEFTTERSCNLTISIDKKYSFRLFDKFELYSTIGTHKVTEGIDSATRMFTLRWFDLPNGHYTLKLTSVFQDTKEYNLHLSGDTSLIVSNFYELHDLNTLTYKNFKESENFDIYYGEKGCFQGETQRLLIKKLNESTYSCTFITDSVTYKDTLGFTKMVIIPVSRSKQINSTIIDDLFCLLTKSQMLQEKVQSEGLECISTNHSTLYTLNNNQLFQFYSQGVCDWNLYDSFINKYFKIP